jgi:hypothetical protein
MWHQLELERREGKTVVYESVEAGVAALRVADAPETTPKRRNAPKRETGRR